MRKGLPLRVALGCFTLSHEGGLRPFVEQMEAERHMQYVSSAERFALQKGEDKGRDEGLKEGREAAIRLLLRLLTHRFGEVPETVQTRLHTLALEQTEAFVDVALASQSLTEFADQLPVVDEIAPSK